MPIYFEIENSRLTPTNIVELSLKYDGGPAQVEALHTLRAGREWTPITMSEGGLFHLAFGAILTGAAVTRGMERTQIAKSVNATVVAEHPQPEEITPPVEAPHA